MNPPARYVVSAPGHDLAHVEVLAIDEAEALALGVEFLKLQPRALAVTPGPFRFPGAMPRDYHLETVRTGGLWVTPTEGPSWFAADLDQATQVALSDAAEGPPRRKGRPKGYPVR